MLVVEHAYVSFREWKLSEMTLTILELPVRAVTFYDYVKSYAIYFRKKKLQMNKQIFFTN